MKSGNLKDDKIERLLSIDATDEDFDSLFEQETIYRHSKMLAHITMKASIQGPQNQHFPHQPMQDRNLMGKSAKFGMDGLTIKNVDQQRVSAKSTYENIRSHSMLQKERNRQSELASKPSMSSNQQSRGQSHKSIE